MSADKNKYCHSEMLTTFDNTVVEKGSSDVSCVYDENQIHRLRKNTFHMRMTSSVRIAESTEEMCTHAALMHTSVDEERFTQPPPPLQPLLQSAPRRASEKNGMKCNENPSALFANNVYI